MSKLTHVQFNVLTKLRTDFAPAPPQAKLLTLETLQYTHGFAESERPPGEVCRWWRRTDAGAHEVSRLMGGKD